jgi:hypothetical protein
MVINRHWTSSVRTWEMEAFEDHGTSAKHTPHLLAVLEGKMMINEWIPGYLILRRTHISVRDWGLDCPPKTSYGSSLHLRNWASLPFELPQCPRWKREGFFNHNVQVSAWFFAVSSARDRRMQRQWWAEAIAESNQLCLIREYWLPGLFFWLLTCCWVPCPGLIRPTTHSPPFLRCWERPWTGHNLATQWHVKTHPWTVGNTSSCAWPNYIDLKMTSPEKRIIDARIRGDVKRNAQFWFVVSCVCFAQLTLLTLLNSGSLFLWRFGQNRNHAKFDCGMYEWVVSDMQ